MHFLNMFLSSSRDVLKYVVIKLNLSYFNYSKKLLLRRIDFFIILIFTIFFIYLKTH
jgi:hypothetical protein